MKRPSLNSLLLALAAAATLLPTAARADRWDDRDDHDHEWRHHRPRVVVVERERPAPQIPFATKTDRRGFVVSPYSGQLLDVRGVKAGTLCYDFTAKGAPYFCP